MTELINEYGYLCLAMAFVVHFIVYPVKIALLFNWMVVAVAAFVYLTIENPWSIWILSSCIPVGMLMLWFVTVEENKG